MVGSVFGTAPRETICKRIAQQYPDCQCEAISCNSGISPGVVKNEEEVARICYFPVMWDAENEEPTTAAFSDAGTSGMSVTRLSHVSTDELLRQEESLIEAKDGRSKGDIYSAVVEEIRSITVETKQAFAVYDTATDENVGHAEICQAFFYPDKTENKKSKEKELRSKLAEVFWSIKVD